MRMTGVSFYESRTEEKVYKTSTNSGMVVGEFVFLFLSNSRESHTMNIRIESTPVATHIKRSGPGWVGVKAEQDIRMVIEKSDTIHFLRSPDVAKPIGFIGTTQIERIVSFEPRDSRLIKR